MIFAHDWLQDYISKKIPKPKDLAELLTFHSFEIEGVEKRKGEWIIDIDVLPNRAHDCLSHIGIARECAVLLGAQLKLPEVKLKESKKIKIKDLVKVQVENREDCPRYGAKVMLEIKEGKTPKYIKERLEACGLQSINSVVDITNYVMLETGQPIHAFDLDKLGKNIVVRRAQKGEKIKTLDDKEYVLDGDILVIADSDKPVAIAGIKGGNSTGIDKDTKNILIEAGNFNQGIIRKASQLLKLKTDASVRFENEIDPSLIDYALERVCQLVGEYNKGEVAGGMIDLYPKKVLPKKIKLDLNYANKLLGLEIPKQKSISILQALGFRVGEKAGGLEVLVPTRRLDVNTQEDLIEEIGRVYGYENIPSVFPNVSLKPQERNNDVFWQSNIQDILKQANYLETYNYSFIGEKDKEIFSFKDELVEVVNPASSLNKYFRPSLMPNLLKIAKENLKQFDEVKVFEIGRVAVLKKGIKEKSMLTAMLIKKNKGDKCFYELKGMATTLLNSLGVSDIWFDEVKPTPEDSKIDLWHPGKRAEIKVGDREIGFLGEIHPIVSGAYGLSQKVFMCDIDFDQLLNVVSEENEFQPISSFPATLRDLAILVPMGTKVVEIMNVINSAGGEIVKDIDLFDSYSGEGVPDGKENFAFHIVYQVLDRTLSSREVNKTHQEIIDALEQNLSWEIRR